MRPENYDDAVDQTAYNTNLSPELCSVNDARSWLC
jgi:hypothetical protein